MRQGHEQCCFVWKNARELAKIFGKHFLPGERLKFRENLRKLGAKNFFFRRSLPRCVLRHSCPWPREGLSSVGLSLALVSDFFCVLGLKPCVLDSTSAVQCPHFSHLRVALPLDSFFFFSGNEPKHKVQ